MLLDYPASDEPVELPGYRGSASGSTPLSPSVVKKESFLDLNLRVRFFHLDPSAFYFLQHPHI